MVEHKMLVLNYIPTITQPYLDSLRVGEFLNLLTEPAVSFGLEVVECLQLVYLHFHNL